MKIEKKVIKTLILENADLEQLWRELDEILGFKEFDAKAYPLIMDIYNELAKE